MIRFKVRRTTSTLLTVPHRLPNQLGKDGAQRVVGRLGMHNESVRSLPGGLS